MFVHCLLCINVAPYLFHQSCSFSLSPLVHTRVEKMTSSALVCFKFTPATYKSLRSRKHESHGGRAAQLLDRRCWQPVPGLKGFCSCVANIMVVYHLCIAKVFKITTSLCLFVLMKPRLQLITVEFRCFAWMTSKYFKTIHKGGMKRINLFFG